MAEKTAVDRRSMGIAGENAVADYLKKQGYIIKERNFRIGRSGEIDIIARDGMYTCFIEVKTRTGLKYGMPSEAVTRDRQRSMARLACVYLQRHGLYTSDVRFDVVEVSVESAGEGIRVKSINHIKDAFRQ